MVDWDGEWIFCLFSWFCKKKYVKATSRSTKKGCELGISSKILKILTFFHDFTQKSRNFYSFSAAAKNFSFDRVKPQFFATIDHVLSLPISDPPTTLRVPAVRFLSFCTRVHLHSDTKMTPGWSTCTIVRGIVGQRVVWGCVYCVRVLLPEKFTFNLFSLKINRDEAIPLKPIP